jgi:uncharacterized protein (DUF885 family)
MFKVSNRFPLSFGNDNRILILQNRKHLSYLGRKSMKYLVMFILILTILMSCNTKEQSNKELKILATNYINAVMENSPEFATYLGNHEYDHRINDYSIEGVKTELDLYRAYLDSLSMINVDNLNQNNFIDYKIMKFNLKSSIFSLDTLRSYEWNPQVYNTGGAIYGLVAREFAPLKERLLNVKERIKAIPAVLEHAKINLINPTKIHTETAIGQNEGIISLIKNDLQSFIDQVPELKDEFAPVQNEAIEALQKYGTWLEKELLPKATRDFRIGNEKFEKKLYYSLNSGLTKEEILARAEKALVETQEEIYNTALPLFKEYFPRRANKDRKKVIKSVLDKLAEDHPTNDNIVQLAEEYLDQCTEFVRKNNLVTVPTEPIKIMVMPEYQRGVAIAYCDAPGALEENGETFYTISPTPKKWTARQSLSFYKEYNNYMLQNLTIHEATPGHYLQLAHANKFNGETILRSIFYSGTFVEGWATYAEQLMAEKGFGGESVKMQQLKMKLRLIINSIIDQKIHTAGMTEQEALDLMMNEGFQEEGEAAGKWRRACMTSTQLSTYFVGNTEINDIRNAYEQKHGKNYDMKALHDQMLSYSSIAPKYVKELMGL